MGWLFNRNTTPVPLEIIDELEEIYASDDPQNPRADDLYSQVLRQGFYMEQSATGEWVWHQEKD